MIMTKKLLDLVCREERPMAAAAAAKVLRIRMRILGFHVSRCVIVPSGGAYGTGTLSKMDAQNLCYNLDELCQSSSRNLGLAVGLASVWSVHDYGEASRNFLFRASA